ELIRQRMPDFPLHLSTQATIYSRAGVEAAAELGYERAVLARELSLEQILDCSVPQIIETEVFVHGALCFCYSGQCQLSRFIGGRSGNKGCCAQPCRLPYSCRGKESYPLSPKDLCLIDHLGELIDAGVSSLKIEGRMKSAEYVATVTRLYRKYIDRYLQWGEYAVSAEDRQELTQIFNRGGFTSGYTWGDPKEGLMSGLLPKNQGIKVGYVSNSAKGGLLADLKLSEPLEMGDVIEVHGRDLFSTKVTYLEELKGKNGLVRVGDMKAEVSPGDEVYRIVSFRLMKKAEESFKGISFDGEPISGKRKIPVDMTLKASCGEPAELTAVCCDADGKKISVRTVCEDVIPQQAINRATSEEEIEKQLSKTGKTPFAPGHIRILQRGQLFIPVSGINKLRRMALSDLAEAKKSTCRRTLPAADLKKAKEDDGYAAPRYFEFCFMSLKDFESADKEDLIEQAQKAGAGREKIKFLLPLRQMAENIMPLLLLEDDIRNMIVPYLSNVTAGAYDKWLQENLSAAAGMAGNFGGRMYVGNISWIKPFADEGIVVMGDYGLNITNREAEAVYKSLGMEGGSVKSLEIEERGCGSYPLMITEHAMKDDILTDRKGVRYIINFDSKNHKTIIRQANTTVDWKQAEVLWKQGKQRVRIYL
ncbi:MAG: U32 family peptidase, partial [Anaerovoracaceae bacterium]